MTKPAPEIGTTATDADDGDHEAVADSDVTIIDEVRYENLQPGREYVLTGTLIDKTTAEPVERDGLPLISVVAFTPAEPNGSVEVEFRFDGSGLSGHRTVAFESLALDGEVVAGSSSIDQAPITGESLPVEKTVGDKVFAGTINQAGSLEFRVTAAANHSTLARIILAVEQAQGARAPTQRFVDSFSKTDSVNFTTINSLVIH